MAEHRCVDDLSNLTHVGEVISLGNEDHWECKCGWLVPIGDVVETLRVQAVARSALDRQRLRDVPA